MSNSHNTVTVRRKMFRLSRLIIYIFYLQSPFFVRQVQKSTNSKLFFRMGSFVTSTPLQKSSNRPSPNRVSPSRPNQSRIPKQKSSPSAKTVRFETEKDSSGMIKIAQNTLNGLFMGHFGARRAKKSLYPDGRVYRWGKTGFPILSFNCDCWGRIRFLG